MTLILNESDWAELCEQAPKPNPGNGIPDGFEIQGVPEHLGRGYSCELELLPSVWVGWSDEKFYQDFTIKVPLHEHLVQCTVVLSGLEHSQEYPTFGGSRGYLSGSGVSPSYAMHHQRSQRLINVHIHLRPEVFAEFYSDLAGSNDTFLKLLLKQEDWKVSFFPPVTQESRQLAQQILQSPFCGLTQRLYLQSKVFDLLSLQLEPILADQRLTSLAPGRKPDTVARIYHAKEILLSRLEQPPSFLELAQRVGVSDRTLRRGFRELFGTTVVGYLTQQRMKQAEQLLREGHYTVAEIANWVGYSHLGHFAAGFKRQFGISPSECLAGKTGSKHLVSVLG
ncbi:helix-turn-helix transcriptional regulator [Oculatella sp. LEGE 06141]|uniref:helix-turn-helix transcriptional regulator n=1 Tax=Oculatella sp. LEGE 06141 TaxID=1828648 RepID=UPI0018822BE5|nr:AraC family transcriptional regulator [Oculatella sp. LEGE 06141]MBE9180604.1 helix-turn-helix transcriptional regulator [Oculatella sp. LEGE 06141]